MYLAISIAKNVNYINNAGILRADGDTTFCMWVDTLGVWLCGLPLAAIGVYLHLPLFAVFALANSHEIIRALLGVQRTLSKKWIQNVVEGHEEAVPVGKG